MEQKKENEMEAGVIAVCIWIICVNIRVTKGPLRMDWGFPPVV